MAEFQTGPKNDFWAYLPHRLNFIARKAGAMFTLSDQNLFLLALSLLTATGYAAATVGMKLATTGMMWAAFIFIATGFLVAAIAEVILIQRHAVSLVYVVIIAMETFLVLTYALSIGEALSPRQIAGAFLVLTGLALTIG
jgi:small multidrug resistance pump